MKPPFYRYQPNVVGTEIPAEHHDKRIADALMPYVDPRWPEVAQEIGRLRPELRVDSFRRRR